jgi:hypothetical protein
MESTECDGYYFRDEDGDTQGPMSKALFEQAEKRGMLFPGAKAWRIQGGAVFVVTIRRRLIPKNICSLDGGMSCCDMVMSFSGIIVIFFYLSIPENRTGLLASMQTNILSTILLFLTVIMTLALTYYAVRLRTREFARVTTSIEHSEV